MFVRTFICFLGRQWKGLPCCCLPEHCRMSLQLGNSFQWERGGISVCLGCQSSPCLCIWAGYMAP